MGDTEDRARREEDRRTLRELGFSDAETARREAAAIESALSVERYRQAAGSILPALFACLEDRPFFDALTDEPRAPVTCGLCACRAIATACCTSSRPTRRGW